MTLISRSEMTTFINTCCREATFLHAAALRLRNMLALRRIPEALSFLIQIGSFPQVAARV
jgi:hypothetical protein